LVEVVCGEMVWIYWNARDAIFSQCVGVPGTYDTLAACDHGVILIHIYI
jgi:hypothetical protein